MKYVRLNEEELEAVKDGISAALHLLLVPKGEGLTVDAETVKTIYKELWTSEAVLTDATINQ